MPPERCFAQALESSGVAGVLASSSPGRVGAAGAANVAHQVRGDAQPGAPHGTDGGPRMTPQMRLTFGRLLAREPAACRPATQVPQASATRQYAHKGARASSAHSISEGLNQVGSTARMGKPFDIPRQAPRRFPTGPPVRISFCLLLFLAAAARHPEWHHEVHSVVPPEGGPVLLGAHTAGTAACRAAAGTGTSKMLTPAST